MFTASFWKDAAKRVIAAFAQSLIAVLGADQFGLLNAPWIDALSVAGMAAFLSLLALITLAGGLPLPVRDSKGKVEVPPVDAETVKRAATEAAESAAKTVEEAVTHVKTVAAESAERDKEAPGDDADKQGSKAS